MLSFTIPTLYVSCGIRFGATTSPLAPVVGRQTSNVQAVPQIQGARRCPARRSGLCL